MFADVPDWLLGVVCVIGLPLLVSYITKEAQAPLKKENDKLKAYIGERDDLLQKRIERNEELHRLSRERDEIIADPDYLRRYWGVLRYARQKEREKFRDDALRNFLMEGFEGKFLRKYPLGTDLRIIVKGERWIDDK